MVRIAIVEDDDIQCNQLREFIEHFCSQKGLTVSVAEFKDGEDIAEDYKPQYDLILMDIQMEYMDGMTAARKIRELDPVVVIVFITNMAGYAIQGYEVEAIDYILKPLSYDMFSHKFERALRFVKRTEVEEYVVIQNKEIRIRLKLSEIQYIESRGHQMEYHTVKGIYSVRGRMDELEEQYADKSFFRSNRGYLVNLNHVSALKGDCIVIDGNLLPISHNRKALLMKKLSEIL